MSIQGWAGTIINSLGPLQGPLGTPVNTKPALAQGIFNNTVGAAAEKVLSGSTNGKKRRVKIVAPAPGTHLGWTTVTRGTTAPTLTAGITGGVATDGSLIEGGGGATEWLSLSDDVDLYLAGSGAGVAYQLTVLEYQ